MTPFLVSTPGRYSLALHGGAGVIARSDFPPGREAEVRAALTEALAAGELVLRAGGSSLAAVTETVRALEDCPFFNAGRGSVLNRDGVCEMDAAIMDGATRRAGAVAGVKSPRNPVVAARAVMEHTPHVLLAGEGADRFLQSHGVPTEPPDYFIVEPRRRQWERITGVLLKTPPTSSLWALERKSDALGTVGAVARDRAGHLAAATSTGGLAAKLPGRIGDSPIIGAGTYADDAVCAISATGHGEYFIRTVVAHEVAALMRHRGWSLREAARRVVEEDLVKCGGDGGLIAIDAAGEIVMPFNTPGMYRAAVREGGTAEVSIYRENEETR